MKAKDTVMDPITLSEKIQYFPNWDLHRGNEFIEELCRYVAEAQAEISFKAGRREVVEWIEKEYGWYYDGLEKIIIENGGYYGQDGDVAKYKAKLKEWGIE